MKPIKITILLAITFALIIVACKSTPEEKATPAWAFSDYPIKPIEIRSVVLTDNFWLPIIKDVQEKTIEYAIQKCKDEGRFDNFLIAGGKMKGTVKGKMPFDDTDVYKIIEGASNSLISSPNKKLEILLDSLIAIVKTGQEADGYITTWRTINPAKPPADWVKVTKGERWEDMGSSHEDYNAGHLYEAAVVHYLATGKKNFLDIATKSANLMVKTFGKGKKEGVPGHEIIETGLIKLYRVTGNEDYLKLAKYFLDTRGDFSSGRQQFGEYAQDHKPVVKQDEVVGHAVRAMYMYAGMTDIAAIYKDSAYRSAIDKLWDNMVYKKMYVTGGIGARHEGEAFGKNYELPNLTAYNETCAAIGDVYWNQRMFMLTGNVKYYDVIERTLYNGLISGLSLDGTHFFYPNPLESDGKNKFNIGATTRQGWFDCSCCPTNVIRFIPSLPGLIYANVSDTLYVNLYASNHAVFEVDGKKVNISQETNYPLEGKVKVTIDTESPQNLVVKFRVPGWIRNEVIPGDLYSYRNKSTVAPSIAIDGKVVDQQPAHGYFTVSRKWSGNQVITLDFPMEVQEVVANTQVIDDKDKTSLEYGPLVYAMEQVDNPSDFDNVHINTDEKFTVRKVPGLLEGVNVIEGSNSSGSFIAIPYYAWSNRGSGKMKVWLPVKQ